MPASEIAEKFREGTLHSGPGGPIVKNPKQALAIRLSYLRKEGHDIPEPRKSLARSYRRAKHGSSES